MTFSNFDVFGIIKGSMIVFVGMTIMTTTQANRIPFPGKLNLAKP